MNTKRQTIWLVSMLSLMVVLSAYYLFTEDVNKLNTATEKAVTDEIKVTTEVKDPAAGGQAVNGGVASSTSTSTSAKTSDAKAAQSSASGKKTDAQVLEEMQASAKTGAGYFDDLARKQNEEIGKVTTKFLDIIADPKKSADEIAKANTDLEKLQDKRAKIDSLEDMLLKNYKNAIVLEDGNKFKAVVQAEKLDAKQASAIITMMIKELNVTKDYVSVQYMN